MYKRILNKKFYVDEIKNTCVCVLEFGIIPQNIIEEEVLGKYASKCKQADKVKTYLQKFEVRGIAKCSPQDTFSDTIGTDIAEFRAEREMSRIESGKVELEPRPENLEVVLDNIYSIIKIFFS